MLAIFVFYDIQSKRLNDSNVFCVNNLWEASHRLTTNLI